jgi:hypothetical protein
MFVGVNLLGEFQPLLGKEKTAGLISEPCRFLCLLPTLVGPGPIFRCRIHSTNFYFTLSSPLVATRETVSDEALCAHHESASRGSRRCGRRPG